VQSVRSSPAKLCCHVPRFTLLDDHKRRCDFLLPSPFSVFIDLTVPCAPLNGWLPFSPPPTSPLISSTPADVPSRLFPRPFRALALPKWAFSAARHHTDFYSLPLERPLPPVFRCCQEFLHHQRGSGCLQLHFSPFPPFVAYKRRLSGPPRFR